MSRRPGLAALFGPRNARDFLKGAWPHTPFVVHASPGRLRGLVDAPELARPARLFELPCADLLAQKPSFSNRFGNVSVAPEVATALLDAGCTVYALEPQFSTPSVERWVRQLEVDLKLAANTIRPSVFVSRRGPGARMHFDNTESFVVQVSGRKAWTLAPNRDIPNPPVNHIAGTPLADELVPLASRPLPTRMPRSATRVVLEPGSVLFMPRGMWHTTQTLSDSVHLDLLMALPTWADVLLPALARLPQWRTPAVPATRLGEVARQLVADVTALVRSVGH